jgi:hypothetical protein
MKINDKIGRENETFYIGWVGAINTIDILGYANL